MLSQVIASLTFVIIGCITSIEFLVTFVGMVIITKQSWFQVLLLQILKMLYCSTVQKVSDMMGA